MAAQPEGYGTVDAEQGDVHAFETPCKDLPPDIRVNFIKKVYGLLFYMLAISFGIAAPFIFGEEAAVRNFMAQYPWLLPVAGAVVLAFFAFNFLVVLTTCCGGQGCLRAYFKFFQTFPLNVIFLTVFSAAFGLFLGLICMQYVTSSVLFVFALSMALVVALTIYAITTKADFTGYGAYLLVLFVGLLLTGLLAALVGGVVLNKLYAGCGAIFFAFIIVYDTQQIFGVSSWSPNERRYQYTVDMYAYCAFELYLDIINFFLYMLQFFGERR